ncbi:protein kinase [Radiobacillus kanasensis]|uniref:serine/threonine protein kinase n=1 Tax=Radiobacillus kanasensis TaxID=2844358 RepID=UPI001E540D50|nr:protein kinase [Radiobacillus kanasensis]UFT98346.1 protein kinase [Radiobacillus kanasensis]
MSFLMKLIKRSYRFMIDPHFKKGSVIHEIYQVQSLLGIGSYGYSYLCYDSQNQRYCVLKQMTKSKRRQVMKDQFAKERDALKRLEHFCIPTFYESFTFQNLSFLVMEYIPGRNLEDVLFEDKQKFTERETLQLMKEIVVILEHVHSKGIIHGDVRIPNVILHDNRPYLIDFGLAERVKDSKVQEDYYDLGDFCLFLLYSQYEGKTKKGRAWTEELILHPNTRIFLEKLLGIREPFIETKEVLAELDQTLVSLD